MTDFTLDTSGEVWRAVVGYEGMYEVSDLGRVRSIDRTVTRHGKALRLQGMLLRQKTNRSGYVYVNISRDSQQKAVLVHRCVALAFIPNPDGKPNVNHFDNDTANNTKPNLRWCTQAENVQHAADQGRMDWARVRKPKAPTFEELDPFCQGYVEAVFASAAPGTGLLDRHGRLGLGFSDLAPETLAAILRDCGLFRATDQWRRFARLCPVGWLNLNKEPGEQAAGAAFWATRNHHTGQSRGDFWTDHAWPSTYAQQLFYAARAFPPLTPSLGDDGKVYLRAADGGEA